jgi:hypothetical protein
MFSIGVLKQQVVGYGLQYNQRRNSTWNTRESQDKEDEYLNMVKRRVAIPSDPQPVQWRHRDNWDGVKGTE